MTTNAEHIATLYPAIQAQMKAFTDEAAKTMNAYINLSYRSVAFQNRLYAQGRTTPGEKVTNAVGGLSFHNYGLAVDVVFKTPKGSWTWDVPRAQWFKLAAIAAKYGIEHGDRGYEDLPHFQIVFGQKPQDLLECFKVNSSLQDVWDSLDELRKGNGDAR